MLFDILSTDMYVSYNVKIAHRIGLHTSIYLTELLNINRKALQKGKIYHEKDIFAGDFVKLDRNYIEQRTTLTKKEQKELDKILSEIGVLKISENSKDIVNLNMDAITALVIDDDESLESKFHLIIKQKTATKEDKITESLKNSLNIDNSELRAAFEGWIDSVVARNGWMSKASIADAKKIIDDYSGMDLDIALEVLRIAKCGGYRDIMWAINQYEKDKPICVHTHKKTGTDLATTALNRAVDFSDEEY